MMDRKINAMCVMPDGLLERGSVWQRPDGSYVNRNGDQKLFENGDKANLAGWCGMSGDAIGLSLAPDGETVVWVLET